MKKKILITGCAGFIGYHLTKKLLMFKKYSIIGIDNLNNYYDNRLKLTRLKNLKINKNFLFYKIDISKKKKLLNNFKEHKYDFIFHFAAQAGVRYSIKYPEQYLKTNVNGFFNILEAARIIKPQFIYFASSSSIYGNQKSLPINEKANTDHPISFYASTKKCNETMAHSYSHLYNLRLIGLRFFTVYGPLGRPDMTPFSFLNLIIKNKKINIYNNGDHKRDFTYIDDVIKSILNIFKRSQDKSYKKKYDLFNIGRGKSEKLIKYINLIEKIIGRKVKKNLISNQAGDVKNTYSNIKKLKKFTGFSPNINIDEGLKTFINWYKKYHKY